MDEARCRPSELIDFFTKANAADDALTEPATALSTALGSISGWEFRPRIDQHGETMLALRDKHKTLNGFCHDVAIAFVRAGGGDPSAITPDQEFSLTDESVIDDDVRQVSVDRATAETDARAIELALESGDEEALREALDIAVSHSDNGTNTSYSATLVLLLGKPGIDGVLDHVDDDGEGTGPDDEDFETIAVPMAILFASATRSNSPSVMAIAEDYIFEGTADVAEVTALNEVIYDQPRERLGLLLAAGQAVPLWTARAADVLLNDYMGRNSQQSAFYNRVALEALRRSDEASFEYTTNGSDDFVTSRDARLSELLHAGPGFSWWGDDYSIDTDTRDEEWRENYDLAGEIIDRGLRQFPEELGDPLTAMDPQTQMRADRAADAFAAIINMSDEDIPNHPQNVLDALNHLNGGIYQALANVNSDTWMMDVIVRDAVEGLRDPFDAIDLRGMSEYVGLADLHRSPGAIANLEVLADFWERVAEDGSARDTLQEGVFRYANYEVSQATIHGTDPNVLLDDATQTLFDIDDLQRPRLDGAGAAISSFVDVINDGESTAAERNQAWANWIRAAGSAVSDTAGTASLGNVVMVPVSVFTPFLSEELAQTIEPGELAGRGGEIQIEATDGTLAVVEYVVQTDPRFAALDVADRMRVVEQLSHTLRTSVTNYGLMVDELENE